MPRGRRTRYSRTCRRSVSASCATSRWSSTAPRGRQLRRAGHASRLSFANRGWRFDSSPALRGTCSTRRRRERVRCLLNLFDGTSRWPRGAFMDFGLSEEQRLVQKTAADFVDREIAPHVREWEAQGAIPREVTRKMAELGFLGGPVPPEYGGAGMDYVAFMLLMEELSRGAPSPRPTVLGA